MAELTTGQFAAAKARGAARMRGPRAVSAHYDRGRNRVIVRLTTGVEIGIAPHDAEGLRGASADDLKVIEVSELGFGIHFPRLDADLYVPALLEWRARIEALDGDGAWRGWRSRAEPRKGGSIARERQARRPTT